MHWNCSVYLSRPLPSAPVCPLPQLSLLPLSFRADLVRHNISPPALCFVVAHSRCTPLPALDFRNMKTCPLPPSLLLLFLFHSPDFVFPPPPLPSSHSQALPCHLRGLLSKSALTSSPTSLSHIHPHTHPLRLNQNGLIPHHSNCGVHQLIQERGPVAQVSQSHFTQKKPDHVAVQTHMHWHRLPAWCRHKGSHRPTLTPNSRFVCLLVFHLWKHLSSGCQLTEVTEPFCSGPGLIKKKRLQQLSVHCCIVQKMYCSWLVWAVFIWLMWTKVWEWTVTTVGLLASRWLMSCQHKASTVSAVDSTEDGVLIFSNQNTITSFTLISVGTFH